MSDFSHPLNGGRVPSKDYVDARSDATEARVDRLETKIDRLFYLMLGQAGALIVSLVVVILKMTTGV